MKNEFTTKTVMLEKIESIGLNHSVISYRDIDEKSNPVGDTIKLIVLNTNIASTAANARYVDLTYPTNLDPKAIIVR